jgi:hypothetical protein
VGFLRRIGLLIGAVAMLVQLIAWSSLPMATMALAMDLAADDLAMCSVHDTTSAASETDARPVAPDAAAHHGHGCPLCTLVQGLSSPPPISAACAPVTLTVAQTVPMSGELVAAAWFLSSLQARAPPVAG